MGTVSSGAADAVGSSVATGASASAAAGGRCINCQRCARIERNNTVAANITKTNATAARPIFVAGVQVSPLALGDFGGGTGIATVPDGPAASGGAGAAGVITPKMSS